jgi:pimeloyl-ACP methyl ester carboxylesterase
MEKSRYLDPSAGSQKETAMTIRKLFVRGAGIIMSVAVALSFLAAYQIAKADSLPGDKVGMVLMHGKGAETDAIWSLGSALRSAGVLVEMPLMPWSRERIYDKGYEESMAEIDTYVARLRKKGATRIIVGGHSLGANAALGYGARRDGLSGVVLLAYGHVPGKAGFARKLSKSTNRAQKMIAAGKGEETASFQDSNQSRGGFVTSSANDLLSWFDPNGPAVIGTNAPKVKPNTPVLCIDGSDDRWNRCASILRLVPTHAKNKKVMVDADHVGTPDASMTTVSDWLRAL